MFFTFFISGVPQRWHKKKSDQLHVDRSEFNSVISKLREDDAVDHVDDTVRCFDICAKHFRTVDHDFALAHGDPGSLAIDRRGIFQFDYVARHHFARHHVIRQNGLQLCLILRLQQRVDGSLRQFCECFIGWRNTINGPLPFSVSTKPAALTAATSALNEPAPTAVSTMSLSAAAFAWTAFTGAEVSTWTREFGHLITTVPLHLDPASAVCGQGQESNR